MFTVKEVAKRLQVSIGFIYKSIASGELECHRFGKAIRVTQAQLDDFLERCKEDRESLHVNHTLKHL